MCEQRTGVGRDRTFLCQTFLPCTTGSPSPPGLHPTATPLDNTIAGLPACDTLSLVSMDAREMYREGTPPTLLPVGPRRWCPLTPAWPPKPTPTPTPEPTLEPTPEPTVAPTPRPLKATYEDLTSTRKHPLASPTNSNTSGRGEGGIYTGHFRKGPSAKITDNGHDYQPAFNRREL